ncbi:MAG: radical SAM protein [Clostridiales bacterium]|nr:radical SAM protein [Clostridiales bacterium]
MKYQGAVYRPPSEARSLIIQVTLGCSHNGCSFCPMYAGEGFKTRGFDEVMADLKKARVEYPHVRRIFFADGDALCMKTEKFLPLLEAAKAIFPECERVSVYARAENLLSKTDEELKMLKDAGLGIVYIGAESGSGEVLRRVNKRETPEDIILAVKRAEALGIPASVTFISGLGGKELMREHAEETGRMIAEMGASYVGLLTLMISPGTPLSIDLAEGRFQPLSTHEVLDELETILKYADCKKDCVLRSNHNSNRLVLAGTLPHDRERLLAQVRQARVDESRLRPRGFRGY